MRRRGGLALLALAALLLLAALAALFHDEVGPRAATRATRGADAPPEASSAPIAPAASAESVASGPAPVVVPAAPGEVAPAVSDSMWWVTVKLLVVHAGSGAPAGAR